MNLAFDKLAFVRKLESANFARNQAEALSDAVHDAVAGTAATKQDILALERRSEATLAQAISSLKLWTVSVGATVVILSGIFLGLLKLK